MCVRLRSFNLSVLVQVGAQLYTHYFHINNFNVEETLIPAGHPLKAGKAHTISLGNNYLFKV